MTINNTLKDASFLRKLQKIKVSRSEIEVYLCRSISDIPTEVWNASAPQDNIFLQKDYLEVLENNPPTGMQFGYLLFIHQKQFAGVALCQLQYFKANQSLNSSEEKPYPCFFTTFLNFIRGMVVNQVEFNVLICGNLLLK